ncbi:hypothetical protein H8S37_12585 [Mediterraneibacter sp. NSJ-55]|uniref:Uncharacterized protein n=1 Tax=Mediterraneibacter hominis TaxID=2763054 RepID=A0A923LKT0_9FIRM|nr:hypothetical protein [Mediterraneibacter hominis]MBC5689754.1 hypothetical protein [Mediterraneibacter hominis]
MDCKTWLREYLADGLLHLCDEVRQAAKKAGYSRGELKQARKKLDVKTFHQFDELGDTGNHFWYLEVR